MRMKSKSSITTRPWRGGVRQSVPVIHPGAFLSEALEQTGLTQAAFARAIGVSSMRISHVVKGARPVSADLALLFGKAFGQSPQYWLNLQALHDLAQAEQAMGARLAGVSTLPASPQPAKGKARS
jgi:addiction module HigA family antidote